MIYWSSEFRCHNTSIVYRPWCRAITSKKGNRRGILTTGVRSKIGGLSPFLRATLRYIEYFDTIYRNSTFPHAIPISAISRAINTILHQTQQPETHYYGRGEVHNRRHRSRPLFQREIPIYRIVRYDISKFDFRYDIQHLDTISQPCRSLLVLSRANNSKQKH